MRFLILDASGTVGHMVAQYLIEAGHDVTGVCRKPVAFVPCVTGSPFDTALVRGLVGTGAFDVVVNAAEPARPNGPDADAREPRAFDLLPHVLASMTFGTPTRVIHLSTRLATPNSHAACGNARGELLDAKNLTLRSSLVGPDLGSLDNGLLGWFMRQDGNARGSLRTLWAGITTLELAKAVEACAVCGVSGMVTMVPDVAISEFGLMKLMNSNLRNDQVRIEPTIDLAGATAEAPLRASGNHSFRPAPYDVQMRELAGWMRAHADWYLQYLQGAGMGATADAAADASTGAGTAGGAVATAPGTMANPVAAAAPGAGAAPSAAAGAGTSALPSAVASARSPLPASRTRTRALRDADGPRHAIAIVHKRQAPRPHALRAWWHRLSQRSANAASQHA